MSARPAASTVAPDDDRLTDLLPGRLQATFWPGAPVPARGHLALWGVDDIPAAAAALGLPAGQPARMATVLPRTPRAHRRVAPVEVPARVVPVLPAVRALVALPSGDDWPAWRRPSDALLVWSHAAKLAVELVAAGRLVPALRPGDPTSVAHWRIAPGTDPRLDDLAACLPPAGHALRSDDDDATVWSAADLVRAFADAVADACARAVSPVASRRDASRPAQRWAGALASPDGLVALDGRTDTLAEELTAWAAPLLGRGGQAVGRLCLRLGVPPDGADRDDTEDDGTDEDGWPVDYLLQAADDPSLMLPAAKVWSDGGGTVSLAGRHLGDAQETLIRGLSEAARLFPPLHESLSEPTPQGIWLSADQAAAFLGEAADALAAAGIGVLLPAELTQTGQRRLRARLRVGSSPGQPGNVTDAGLNADTLAEFTWEVALGDATLTREEFEAIVALKRPLVRWRGRWVRVDPDQATRLADLAGRRGTLGLAEALGAGLVGERDDPALGAVEVVTDGFVADLIERLRAGDGGREPRLTDIEATLRPYQRRGVAWLQTMAGLGLGAVLADDMGLGKTLQAICLLADRPGDRPHLVVCPTSVVGNWEREIARFAPGLKVVRHHGPGRPTGPDGFPPGAVAVTSYQLLRRDREMLADVDWDVVVLDEAQQVKNHRTKAARAVRQLPAAVRVTMTGTPVENRLADLWAILDATIPGLLGPFGRFTTTFAIPVERWGDEPAAARLRRLVAPFVLRREKTDPAVAADLPAKQEYSVVCSLTREQATLYQAAVDQVLGGDLGEGIDRRGRILALLTALKQVCNHPAQYLGENGPLPGRSGKLSRATEILAEVIDGGRRALVFTQYRAMGDLLATHLARVLDLPDVPFLHGGVPRARRDEMVRAFQEDADAPPVLLVSLKAGGTGLNLTAATHVVHYDRWWNPAVEDQATDRAYRIGQTRTVTVHKLVTAGTLEERIAQLLESKRALAEAVVGAGETWLTELDDDQLRALVALSADDVLDDDGEDG